MRILTTSAALSAALLLSVASASPSFAKGHNNGFGGQATGSLSGQVDDGQKNLTGGREGSYGIRDQLVDVEAFKNDEFKGGGNSGAAQTRDGSHPSERN
jgi:type 1 fimbria pilin